MTNELDVKAILCGPAESKKDTDTATDTATFLAVVRPGKNNQTFSMSLQNNNQWIDMKVADVIEARDYGRVKSDGKLYKLVEITIPRSKEAGVWFDLFKDAVSLLSKCVTGTKTISGCACSNHEASPGQRTPRMANPEPTILPSGGVDADCYYCWRCLYFGCWHCRWICGGNEPTWT